MLSVITSIFTACLLLLSSIFCLVVLMISLFNLCFLFFVYLPAKYENTDESEEGTRHFMVNVIEPQFNLHSEGASVSLNFILFLFHFR
jgi:hypothetical protein